MVTTAVKQGVWKLEQNNDTMMMYLYKYEDIIDSWKADNLLTWDQMYEVLLTESYKRRSED